MAVLIDDHNYSRHFTKREQRDYLTVIRTYREFVDRALRRGGIPARSAVYSSK
jgi:hypothetical protein